MSFPPPRRVARGSRLAIVAPAGRFDEEAFQLGVEWLRQRYAISHSPEIFSCDGYFAGNDERRLAELEQAIADPSVDAILCARGGFGATRLLPGLKPASVATANKLLVGFSDITALHALWARAGIRSLHAPMVSALGKATDSLRATWIDALENPVTTRRWDLSRLCLGAQEKAEGVLVGGNLAVLCALVGTPYAPPLDKAVLFLEDVGERPYRVDRMLTTLQQAGWFDRIRGLVLGAFTEGTPGPDGVTLDAVFARHFSDAPFPVLAGLPAGHIEENDSLVFGATASIVGETLTAK